MEEILVIITCIATVFLLQWPAARVCHRNDALIPWRGILSLSAILWGLMPAIKVFCLDYLIPPGDGRVHERLARELSLILVDGNFANLWEHFGYGNHGYRFLLGVFYALTGAPRIAPYAINAALAFWGMTALLEVICRQTEASRVPLWLIFITVFLPSALFWTPNNLKEGLCLWGICMMLRATLRDPATGARERFLPLLGFAAVAFQRPHIAMAFAAAVGIGLLISEKKIRYVLLIIAGIFVGFQVLQLVRPQLVNDFLQDGVAETMDASYESSMGMGGSAIYHPGGRPIPVITGLTLIFLRPFPHEINGIAGAMAAFEVWFITSICVAGWMKLPSKGRILLDPFTMTLLAAILFMAFFFSYCYNMGLLVRQRLHVLPAVIALTAIPHLLPRGPRPIEDVDLDALPPGERRSTMIG